MLNVPLLGIILALTLNLHHSLNFITHTGGPSGGGGGGGGGGGLLNTMGGGKIFHTPHHKHTYTVINLCIHIIYI